MGKKFTAEYQPERKPRGLGRRTMLLNAIKEVTKNDEEAFYQEIVRRAVNPEDSASPMLMKEIMSRLYPGSKPTMPLVKFSFPDGGTPTEKVDALERAVANEEIPIDIAKEMISIMKMSLEIQELTDFAKKLEELESKLEALRNA